MESEYNLLGFILILILMIGICRHIFHYEIDVFWLLVGSAIYQCVKIWRNK